MTFNTDIEKTEKEIAVLQKKLELLKEIETHKSQPRMEFSFGGKFEVVSYNDEVYYRLELPDEFYWYKNKYSDEGVLMVAITDGETHHLLEGLWFNQVRKGKYDEPEDNEWKTVALGFGENLSDVGPDGYYDFTPKEWIDWAVNTYGKGQQKDYKVGVDEPSMINCVISGNPPDGYVAWNEWYNEMGSKGILHNLKISSKDYKPTPQERGERVHKEMEELVRESVKWCEENPDKDPLDWLKPQTPEETAQSLKKAFVEAQQTEKWKETQKLIDEEDNDKNFKNSLDLIKEWGEEHKPKTLYQICMEWWDEVFVNQMVSDACIDVLVSRIDTEFLPPSHDTNGYEWDKCLKMMREKLR